MPKHNLFAYSITLHLLTVRQHGMQNVLNFLMDSGVPSDFVANYIATFWYIEFEKANTENDTTFFAENYSTHKHFMDYHVEARPQVNWKNFKEWKEENMWN